MKYIRLLSRLLVGVVFIFSGFVKAVDPLGSTYKFSDYFAAFRLDFLDALSFPLALILSSLELVLGLVLILGYRKKVMYWVLLVFMSFFTLLTFILAIFNPVHDCGCFGDALILTNWQTFFKNIVLMVFVLVLFADRNSENTKGVIAQWLVVLALFTMVIEFSVWNHHHLPLLDFRPYKVGTLIAEGMEIPEGAAMDEYETTLVYRDKQSGKEESFGMDNYPKDTARWAFVSSESKLIKKGFEPPIHDFALMDDYGIDIVDQILLDPGYTLLMISYDLEKADEEALQKADAWAGLEILSDNYSFHAVSASTGDIVESIRSELELDYSFLAADEIMLKTIVRSNPGFVLIAQGSILGKWAYRDFPGLEELNPEIAEELENASAPLDEETRLLMEAGVLDNFSYQVLDFSNLLPDLVLKPARESKEKGVILAFVLSVLLLLVISHQIKKIEF